jgi:hypothetical protein
LAKKFNCKYWDRVSAIYNEVFEPEYPLDKRACYHRWKSCLKPEVVKAPWLEIDDWVLLIQAELVNNNWKELKKHLPGRTTEDIRTRLISRLEKWVIKILDEIQLEIYGSMIYIEEYYDISHLISQQTDNKILTCNPCLAGIEPYLPQYMTGKSIISFLEHMQDFCNQLTEQRIKDKIANDEWLKKQRPRYEPPKEEDK